jgi:hypothetical protein
MGECCAHLVRWVSFPASEGDRGSVGLEESERCKI